MDRSEIKHRLEADTSRNTSNKEIYFRDVPADVIHFFQAGYENIRGRVFDLDNPRPEVQSASQTLEKKTPIWKRAWTAIKSGLVPQESQFEEPIIVSRMPLYNPDLWESKILNVDLRVRLEANQQSFNKFRKMLMEILNTDGVFQRHLRAQFPIDRIEELCTYQRVRVTDSFYLSLPPLTAFYELTEQQQQLFSEIYRFWVLGEEKIKKLHDLGNPTARRVVQVQPIFDFFIARREPSLAAEVLQLYSQADAAFYVQIMDWVLSDSPTPPEISAIERQPDLPMYSSNHQFNDGDYTAAARETMSRYQYSDLPGEIFILGDQEVKQFISSSVDRVTELVREGKRVIIYIPDQVEYEEYAERRDVKSVRAVFRSSSYMTSQVIEALPQEVRQRITFTFSPNHVIDIIQRECAVGTVPQVLAFDDFTYSWVKVGGADFPTLVNKMQKAGFEEWQMRQLIELRLLASTATQRTGLMYHTVSEYGFSGKQLFTGLHGDLDYAVQEYQRRHGPLPTSLAKPSKTYEYLQGKRIIGKVLLPQYWSKIQS